LRAARAIAERHAERGLETLWLSDEKREMLGAQSISLAELGGALARGTALPRLGLVVVDARVALSAEALATLRYGLHRMFARSRVSPDILVLGTSASVATIARAIGAAEPVIVRPSDPLPTRPILRYLLPGLPDPRLAAAPPEHVRFVALD